MKIPTETQIRDAISRAWHRCAISGGTTYGDAMDAAAKEVMALLQPECQPPANPTTPQAEG